MFLTLAFVLAASPAEAAPAPRLLGESIELKTDTGTLYGTLDLPPTPAPWPVVILHAGSGPTDRDGNGPFIATDCLKQVGRALAKEGIAVLRFDKRGIARSAKAMVKEESIRLDTYAADVLAWAALLRKDSRFGKLGFIGHSEGALIGLLAASEAKFDAFVSLCGPGRPLQVVLREQLKKNFPAELYKKCDAIMTDLEAGKTVKETPKELATLFRASVQPYLISVFTRDPAKLAAKLKCPMLIVSGTTDIQVSAADANSLAKANPMAKVAIIEGMNHVLRAVKETNRLLQLPSYTNPTLPLHPKLMSVLSGFLKATLSAK